MKHLESREQVALINWCSVNRIKDTKFFIRQFIFAIPNGGKIPGSKTQARITGSRLKMEGLTAGVPDLFFAWPTGLYAGLFIEMKKTIIKGESKPTVSKSQKAMMNLLAISGYAVRVCYGYDEAVKCIKDYLDYQEIDKNYTG